MIRSSIGVNYCSFEGFYYTSWLSSSLSLRMKDELKPQNSDLDPDFSLTHIRCHTQTLSHKFLCVQILGLSLDPSLIKTKYVPTDKKH